MSQYFVTKNDQQIGPLSEEELAAGVLRGRFSTNDLVWKEGMANWIELSKMFPVLRNKTALVPPPVQAKKDIPKIWNPRAAANWGIVFLPLGIFLHGKNALTLNRTNERRFNLFWFLVSLIYILIVSFLSGFADTESKQEEFRSVIWWPWVIIFFAWYLSTARSQIKFVANEYGDDYEKKSWAVPLTVCAVTYFVFQSFLFSTNHHEEKREANNLYDAAAYDRAVAAADSFRKDNSQTATGVSPRSMQELVKFDDSEWTVIEARQLGSTLRGGEFSEPKRTEGKFIYVRFKVKNITNEEQSILFTPAVIDSRGRRFEQFDDQFLYLPDKEESMTLEQLPSGLPKTFSAIFEMPSDATGISFLTRNFKTFGKDEIPVSLGF